MGRARPCNSQLWMHFTDQQPSWSPPGTELRVEDAWLQHMGMSGYVVFLFEMDSQCGKFLSRKMAELLAGEGRQKP